MIKSRWIATLVLALVPAVVSADTLKETFDRTYPLQPGQRFELDNTNGSVTIQSWDRPEVRIRAEKRVRARDAKYAREVMAKLQIRVTPSAGRLTVNTVTPDLGDSFFEWLAGMSADANVAYTITVPRRVQLDVDTVNGAVAASDVAGDLNIETTNGRISLVRAAGRLDLSTTNGAIDVHMRELSAQGPHKIDTTNGRVTVQLPSSARAQLDVKTTNGAIRSEFPTAISTSDHNRLRGTINGGGPALVVRTTNGAVKIARL